MRYQSGCLGKVTRLWDGRPSSGGSIPGRDQILFFHLQRPYRLWGLPSLLFIAYLEICPQGVKSLGREADHSAPSGAEVKSDGTIALLLHKTSWRCT